MKVIKLLRRILTGAVILVLFRLYIFGILALLIGPDAQRLARYFIILPILSALLIWFIKPRKLQTYKEYLFLPTIVITILIGIVNIILLSGFYPEIEIGSIIKDISLFHLFLIFPLLLLKTQFKKDDYRYILDTVVTIVLYIGGPLIIFEALGYLLGWFTFQDTYNFIGAEVYGLREVGAQREVVARPLGIMGDSAISGVLFAACTVYYFVQKLSLQKLHNANDQNSKKYHWTPVVIGIVAVISATSLTSILILILTMFYSMFKYAKLRFKILNIPSMAIFFFLGIIYFPTFDIYGYMMSYIKEKDAFMPIFLPKLSWSDFPFWGYFDVGPEYNAGEFHFFDPMLRYGFLPFIPWILLVLFPLAKIFRILPIWYQDRAPMMLCLVFLLAISHYSGLERWGNNYIYALAAVMLIRSDGKNNLILKG